MRHGCITRVVRRIWAHVLYSEEITLVVSAIESETKRREGEDEVGNEAEERARKRREEKNPGEDGGKD